MNWPACRVDPLLSLAEAPPLGQLLEFAPLLRLSLALAALAPPPPPRLSLALAPPLRLSLALVPPLRLSLAPVPPLCLSLALAPPLRYPSESLLVVVLSPVQAVLRFPGI